MTPEGIKEIVESVIDQKFQYYNFYLLGAIVISVLITYFISYFKEKAKNLATKEDIQEITEKIESIKHDYNKQLEEFKHDYNKQLEEFKQEQLIRYKAEIVAKVIAEWISNPADNKRLHQLTFEAFLWLPDDICHELSKRLCNKDDALPFKEILIATRKHLLKETNLEAREIVHFPNLTTPQGEENGR